MVSQYELDNLADNWAHDHLPFEHYGHRTTLYVFVVDAYKAGYDQAVADALEELR